MSMRTLTTLRPYVFTRLCAGAMLLAGACVAQAANLGFLNDTPISYMKQRDIDSVKKSVDDVLSHKQDGETANWVNEGTGNSVRIEAAMTPEATSQDNGTTCRTVAVVLSAKGQSMNLKPRFCKQGGQWKMQKRQ